jgi:hypothetical protein
MKARKGSRARSASRAAASAAAGLVWSVPLDIDTIPDTGLHREISASPETCAAVAKLAGVRAMSHLKASFDLSKAGEAVRVTGRVSARVGQNCVVTLDPLETDLDEPIEVLFAPVPPEGSAASEEHRRKANEDPPEPLIDGTIDLGAIATEFLVLGIEPYPRKPGVEFTPPEIEPDGPHPFAALAALKKGSGGDEP